MRQIISHISKEGPIPSRKRNAKLIRYSHLTVRVRHPQASGKIVEVANLLVLKTVRRCESKKKKGGLKNVLQKIKWWWWQRSQRRRAALQCGPPFLLARQMKTRGSF